MTVTIISGLVKNCVQWLCNTRCLLCAGPIFSDMHLCVHCFNALPWLGKSCFQCALPIAVDEKDIRCGICLQNVYAFDRIVSAFTYDFPITAFITRFKFGGAFACGAVLGYLLAHVIRATYRSSPLPEIIIPMPLHGLRLKDRGYNQATVLGVMLKKQVGIPLLRRGLLRIRHTDAQVGMAACERSINMEGAFKASTLLARYKHVALLDDVVTTTQTISAAARAIQYESDCQIDVWSVARTLLPSDRIRGS